MKISIDVIQARTKQLNNNLELHLCNLALKAPPSFTRSYLLGTRSRIAKLGFERLVDEGVFELAGSNALGKTYRINLKKLDLYKHACQETNREEASKGSDWASINQAAKRGSPPAR